MFASGLPVVSEWPVTRMRPGLSSGEGGGGFGGAVGAAGGEAWRCRARTAPARAGGGLRDTTAWVPGAGRGSGSPDLAASSRAAKLASAAVPSGTGAPASGAATSMGDGARGGEGQDLGGLAQHREFGVACGELGLEAVDLGGLAGEVAEQPLDLGGGFGRVVRGGLGRDLGTGRCGFGLARREGVGEGVAFGRGGVELGAQAVALGLGLGEPGLDLGYGRVSGGRGRRSGLGDRRVGGGLCDHDRRGRVGRLGPVAAQRLHTDIGSARKERRKRRVFQLHPDRPARSDPAKWRAALFWLTID